MTSLLPIRTKEEAWATLPNEVSIPIKGDHYKFRRRWFKLRNQTTFSTFLPAKFPSDKPYKMLTIGVFEGAQEVWMMQNLLCHPDSRLYCIDPWHDTGKLDQKFMNECYENAQMNLSQWDRQVNLQRAFSQELMTSAVQDGGYLGEALGTFDFVIIDGDHNAEPVYRDAVNAFAFLKPGGWMLFDDVRNQVPKKDHVKEGLEMFLPEYASKLKFVWAHRFCDCYEKL